MKAFLSRPGRLAVYLSGIGVFAMTLFYVMLSIAPCLVGGVCYHGYSSAYSFDIDKAHNAAWMAKLPDEVNITSLSIPGTHDTMTYNIGSERLQCQNGNLSVQLESGLRYFDIRARLRDDELHIYHAYGYTGFSFSDVLHDMFHFLDENPSEAIIMRLKEEARPLGKNTRTFEEAFNYYRFNSSETSKGAEKHFHAYDRTRPIPTMGELRSKIFILQEFTARQGPYGLAWEGDQMVLEDLWIIPDIYHLAEKWTAIRDALERAALDPQDNKKLYLAHLSASVGVLPIEAAAGPLNHTIEGMNDMTGQWLTDYGGEDDAQRTGVVIIDFPGKRLIDAVLRWNKPLMQ
ncbi:1-phosphatidylinositol phosphodiesterase [Paramyrothecium foliicola]|nr:1-phosphatidylinositol phosphodiesterase [Paramyrothecium foliicola]